MALVLSQSGMDLNQKEVVITGASSGLGLATAKNLLAQGAHVVIASRQSPDLEMVKKELASDSCEIIACDISQPEEVAALAKKVTQADILINNAGIWLEGELESYDDEQIKNVLAVNLTGTILVTKAFLPGFKKRNSGFILNVVSTSGLLARELQSVYAASKWGVRGFTEVLKNELSKTEIRVVGFYPGGMNTGLFSKGGSERDTAKYIQPEAMADVIAFILSRPDSMLISDITISRTAK